MDPWRKLYSAFEPLRRATPERFGHDRDTGETIVVGPPVTHPTWLSRDRWIAFMSLGDGYADLAYTVDLTTGRLTKRDDLHEPLAALKGIPWRLSPDRAWMLYGGSYLTAFRIDGKRTVDWKTPLPQGDALCFWRADGRVVALGDFTARSTRALVYAMGRSKPLRDRRLPGLTTRRFLGLLPNGDALLADRHRDGHIALAALGLDDLRLRRRWSVPIGKARRADDLALSPDGRSIAFLCDREIGQVGLDGGGLRRLADLPPQLNEYVPFKLMGWRPGGGPVVCDAWSLYALYR